MSVKDSIAEFFVALKSFQAYTNYTGNRNQNNIKTESYNANIERLMALFTSVACAKLRL